MVLGDAPYGYAGVELQGSLILLKFGQIKFKKVIYWACGSTLHL